MPPESGGRRPGLTLQLAAYASATRLDALPPEVLARAKVLLLDHAACVVRARGTWDGAPALLAGARALGLGEGGGGASGDAARRAPAGAALLDVALARSLDLDDVHPEAALHPGAVVFPAALAAAETAGAHGADLLAAAVAGYDVACRLSLALPTAAHRARGFHPTATCGVFGAAAAAARVFGLGPEATASALGTALGACGGTLHFLSGGGATGLFQVGWAAAGGLAAAVLAREGLAGSGTALEGPHGFLAAFAPAAAPSRAARGLGAEFEIMRVLTKSYPEGTPGAPSAEAAAEKFAAMAEPILGAERAARLAEALGAVDGMADLAALPRLAAPPARLGGRA